LSTTRLFRKINLRGPYFPKEPFEHSNLPWGKHSCLIREHT